MFFYSKLFYNNSFNLLYCHRFIKSRFINSKNRSKKVVATEFFDDNVSDDSSDYSESEEESTSNIGGNLGVTVTKRVNDNTNDDDNIF